MRTSIQRSMHPFYACPVCGCKNIIKQRFQSDFDGSCFPTREYVCTQCSSKYRTLEVRTDLAFAGEGIFRSVDVLADLCPNVKL